MGGPFHTEDDPEAQKSTEFLRGWGGAWMLNRLVMQEDPNWITEALTNNTLVYVTDSIYNQKKAPDICASGWIIYCTATKRHISATLIKRLDSLSNYRGEFLGILTVHLFIYAIREYYGVTGTNNILCNNKGVLYTFERRSKRIPAGAKNNNVQLVLWQVNSKMKSLHLLHHVKVHQANYKKNAPTYH